MHFDFKWGQALKQPRATTVIHRRHTAISFRNFLLHQITNNNFTDNTLLFATPDVPYDTARYALPQYQASISGRAFAYGYREPVSELADAGCCLNQIPTTTAQLHVAGPSQSVTIISSTGALQHSSTRSTYQSELEVTGTCPSEEHISPSWTPSSARAPVRRSRGNQSTAVHRGPKTKSRMRYTCESL